MSEERESLRQALEDRDITLALTPAQVVLAALGVWLLVRVIRGLRR
jgi:hypothetical protein